MSRIGMLPITVKPSVTVASEKSIVTVQGPKGSLSFLMPEGVMLRQKDGTVIVEVSSGKNADALHGLVRAHIQNMVKGVEDGWTKKLTLTGVGYRAAMSGANVVLTVGFSHPVSVTPPQGIAFTVEEGKIVVAGIDKQLVGQIASNIRDIKPPEPYKGKGITYEGERVRKKAGKSAKGVGGAPGAAK